LLTSACIDYSLVASEEYGVGYGEVASRHKQNEIINNKSNNLKEDSNEKKHK